MLEFDKKYFSKFNLVAGVDEAGRGPLAGPVVASAVVYDSETYIDGVDDSKKISKKKREIYYDEIISKADHIGVGIVYPEKIDEINILNATKEAMDKAIQNLGIIPDIVLVDGNQIEFSNYNQKSIIKGDSKSFSIASASIVAKVTRDRIMDSYSKLLPEYGFESHKGYGTKKHLEAIYKYKSSIIHRKSFRPIKDYLPKFNYYIDNNIIDRLLVQMAGDYLIKNRCEIIKVEYPLIHVNFKEVESVYCITSNIDSKQSTQYCTKDCRYSKLINIHYQNGKCKIVIKDINQS